jgi:hypothetical protein
MTDVRDVSVRNRIKTFAKQVAKHKTRQNNKLSKLQVLWKLLIISEARLWQMTNCWSGFSSDRFKGWTAHTKGCDNFKFLLFFIWAIFHFNLKAFYNPWKGQHQFRINSDHRCTQTGKGAMYRMPRGPHDKLKKLF